MNAPTVDIENTHSGHIIPGDWYTHTNISGIPSEGLQDISTNLHKSRDARTIRDDYADYFVEEGSVDWQIRMIC